MEDNSLLPSNQYGFRQQRSTVTAWAEIQEWAKKLARYMQGCRISDKINTKIVGRCGPVGLFVSKLTTAPRDLGSNPRGVRK